MIKKIYIMILFVLIGGSLIGQENFVLHNFHAVPQNYMTNPAVKSPSKVVIGFPALSSLYLGLQGSSFTLKEAFIQDPNSDSLILDIDGMLEKMDDQYSIGFTLQEEILFVGFSIPKGFVSIGASLVTDFRLGIDSDLFKVAWYGPADPMFMNKEISFSEMDIYFNSYMQFHAGLSYDVSEDLTVGARIKYLKGLANLSVEKFNATLKTRPDPETVFALETTADISINSTFDFLDDEENKDFDIADILSAKNSGFAIDIGARYTGIENFEFNFSIVDLGSINWKSNVKNYTSEGAFYEFTGLSVENLNDSSFSFDEIIDTIQERFKFDKDETSYKTGLPTKFYLGASYKLDEKSNVDLLLYGRAYSNSFEPAISLGINRQFSRLFGLRATYSIVNNTYANIGLGMSLKLGPIQIYTMADNVLAAANPWNNRSFNFRFGLNINIHGKKVIEQSEIREN